MSIKVRMVDGKNELMIKINKRTTVVDLKNEVEKRLRIKKDLQRLFFSGKQLENGCELDSYNINYDDVVLLMVRMNDKNIGKDVTVKDKSAKNINLEEENKKLEEAKSLYYKIGDVDCNNEMTGAWYEVIIKNIFKEEDKIAYKVLWQIDNTISDKVPETCLRPRTRHSLSDEELSVGQKIMINYNVDEPKQIGLWYDFTISDIKIKRKRCELFGRLHISGGNELDVYKVVKKEIYAIETPKLLTERTVEDEQFMTSNSKRPMPPNCDDCRDDPNKKCQSCGCSICAGKEEEHTLLICDECDYMYHMKCLSPPLLEVPQEIHWYCPECKNDENEIVKAGDKPQENRRRRLMIPSKKTRNWGNGMACARRNTICTIVPENHIGPIPGVDVGTTWEYRTGVSEAGVHRPSVAGIHGRSKEGAFSIVFSGGYEGDYDNGDEFIYSGSGGRDLEGNKRTNVQSKDQELKGLNLALARNCYAKINQSGAEASETDWRKGIPVRVVRNYKLKKSSTFAPTNGNRYDGIYKVVRYYPDKNNDGYIMWKYVLRRDDPTPAPWTEEGKKRIASLGLNTLEDEDGDTKKIKETKSRKRRYIDNEENNVEITESKKIKYAFELNKELKTLIENDKVNAKLWADCKATLIDGKPAFLKCVFNRFKCPCCLAILYNPVTIPCGHNICLKCVQKSFASEFYSCPTCRHSLNKTYDINFNQILSSALLLIYLGYRGEQ